MKKAPLAAAGAFPNVSTLLNAGTMRGEPLGALGRGGQLNAK